MSVPPSRDDEPGLGKRKRHVSAVPTDLDSLSIPKRRSSLRGTVPGNSDIMQTNFDELQPGKMSQDKVHPYSRSNGLAKQLEDLTEEVSTLEADKKLPFSRALRTSSAILSTPVKPAVATFDGQTPTALPYDKKTRDELLATPSKRRAISYGNVVDKTPSSQDRFIPSRRRVEDLVDSFKANKPYHELSPAQQQLRRNGVNYDPFTSRRVTPQSNNVPDTGSGTFLPIEATSTEGVWSVEGALSRRGSIGEINAGRGISLGSGTICPVFKANFFNTETAQGSQERYEGRLAAALDLDRASSVLDFSFGTTTDRSRTTSNRITVWRNGEWVSEGPISLLDAPSLRDDFYCSVLAYDPISNVLAVGLKNRVYLWSEAEGVQQSLRDDSTDPNCHVTCLSFSSAGGGKSILAMGRNDGRVSLWQHDETDNRIVFCLKKPVACLAFKPVPNKKFSRSRRAVVTTEDLLVGDKIGNIYYFRVEWPLEDALDADTSMTMLAKLPFHTQQVCSVTWSPDGQYFASGGNDNLCFLVVAKDIVDTLNGRRAGRSEQSRSSVSSASASTSESTTGTDRFLTTPEIRRANSLFTQNHRPTIPTVPLQLGREQAKFRWPHSAAVKAIAFCPWQQGLVATGGGSNDRAIHFFHTGSGVCLATIKVYAQVTSLIWSQTRREICATFGYAQPDHPYRIAVFTWPACEQVLRIPWHSNIRALYAIPYPGGPNQESIAQGRNGRRGRTKDAEGGTWWSRTKEEGCIVVASSDESVKFHEVWSGQSSSMGSQRGGLAWSRILESEEGGDDGMGSDEIVR